VIIDGFVVLVLGVLGFCFRVPKMIIALDFLLRC
jgi:hypothetical protein